MPGTATGLFLIDFIVRPLLRIFGKAPLLLMLILLLVYATIGYLIVRSMYKEGLYR